MPKTKTITLTITLEYETPEPQNGIKGGYLVNDWCEDFEKLSTRTQQAVCDELQEIINNN